MRSKVIAWKFHLFRVFGTRISGAVGSGNRGETSNAGAPWWGFCGVGKLFFHSGGGGACSIGVSLGRFFRLNAFRRGFSGIFGSGNSGGTFRGAPDGAPCGISAALRTALRAEFLWHFRRNFLRSCGQCSVRNFCGTLGETFCGATDNALCGISAAFRYAPLRAEFLRCYGDAPARRLSAVFGKLVLGRLATHSIDVYLGIFPYTMVIL